MSDMPTGTTKCPICGFAEPHTHDAQTVEWHRTGNRIDPSGFKWGPLNGAQRESLRQDAERQRRTAALKAEFDDCPHRYVEQYGTINSIEGAFVVQWLLERIDRVESALEAERAKSALATVAWRKAEDELAEERRMVDELIAALPKCDCGKPATKAIKRGGGRWCDECGPIDADYPRAAPLRAILAARRSQR